VKRFFENERGEQRKEPYKKADRELGYQFESTESGKNIRATLIIATVLFITFIFVFTLRMALAMGNKIDFIYDSSF